MAIGAAIARAPKPRRSPARVVSFGHNHVTHRGCEGLGLDGEKSDGCGKALGDDRTLRGAGGRAALLLERDGEHGPGDNWPRTG